MRAQQVSDFSSEIERIQAEKSKDLGVSLERVLSPYLFMIESAGALHKPSAEYALPEWRFYFAKLARSIMRKAISIRARLSRTSYSHEFIWPAHGEGYDRIRMKPAYDYVDSSKINGMTHQVAFTRSPALVVYYENGDGEMERIVLCRAEVVVMPRPLEIS